MIPIFMLILVFNNAVIERVDDVVAWGWSLELICTAFFVTAKLPTPGIEPRVYSLGELPVPWRLSLVGGTVA